MEPGDRFVIVGAALFIAFIAGLIILVKVRAARFEPKGALADALADASHRFYLEMPASAEALDVYVQYTLDGTRRSGGGISYGMVMRVDIEREAADGGYRGKGAGFSQQAEYLCGQAQRPFGEVPVGESLDAGPIIRRGMQVRRGLLLATVPAGGKLIVRGHAATMAATSLTSLLLFVKRARG